MTSPPSAAGLKYSAFISYSHADERWAKWLQKALEAYRLPARLVGTQTAAGTLPRRLAPVFRDRSDLSSATDLGATIESALRESGSLIVICSPSASASQWVNAEIEAFRQLGQGERIFCLIVAGEPNATGLPGREAEECLPSAFRSGGDADAAAIGRRREPVAADARKGGDGKGNARLKILAGLLGVPFDVLKQREHRRRYQRLALLAALALAALVITLGLAIEAVIARRAAEQRQREAESLVDFMLGDLNDKLRQVQRLDILEAVDSHAMAYFLARPTQDVSDETLLLRVKALQKIGNVREDQGRLPAAVESYRGAAALAAELVRRAPGDVEREAAYAETLNHLGNAYWFQGNLSQALEGFLESIRLLERATAVRPSDQRLAVLAFARTNAGRVLEARGEFAAAQTLYETVLATFKTLSSRDPAGVAWQAELGDAYDNLGKLALERGELVQAIAAYRDVRRIKGRLSARTPSDRNVQESLLISEAILGRTLALCGVDDAATRYLGEAVRLAAALVAFDATQADWREEFADYSRELGALARGAGRLDEAARMNGDALRVFGELVASDPTNSSWRRELAGVQVEAAQLQLVRGNAARAEPLLETALATIDAERTANPADRNVVLVEARALLVLGQAATRRHDAVAARRHWTRARDIIAAAARVGADPNFLAVWASALLLLDDTGAARPVIDQLAAIGYRRPDFDRLLATKQQTYRVSSGAAHCGADERGVTGAREFE